jgi:hypothetical protein
MTSWRWTLALKERLGELPVLGTAIAVNDRYTDDLGNHLAASIAFFAFLSLFPILLLGLAVAGTVFADDPQAQQEVVDAVSAAVPGLGEALGETIDVAIRTRGATGLVGLVGVLFAGLRVVDAATLAVSRVFRVDATHDSGVVRKARASAFFGTHLITYLVRKNIDCLLVTGTSTCGCVRGTVLDGYSYGYPVFAVEECIFDRSRTSHLVNLFEMNAKYASVIPLKEALDYVNRLKRMEGRKAQQ